MKIAHIESGRHLYGGARQVGYLLDGLARHGVDNVLICPPDHALARARARAAVVELPMGGDLDLGMLGRLRRVLAELKPDLVHIHSRRGADLFAGRACNDAGFPAVLTRRVDNPELAAWARFKYRPYRFVVAISRAVRVELCGRCGLPAARVPLIPSAVDTATFRPDPDARERLLREFGLDAAAFVIGVAAQLIPRKGHAFLLRALPDIVRRHPEVRVLCFGRGPSARRLRRLAAALGLASCVTFTGFREDFASLLPGIDLLVHPARREGLGVAVLEAMSCAVPVIAAAAGGVVEALTDEREGLLVPFGRRAELGAAIESLIGDETARRRLGAAGRIRVEHEFTIARMTDRYVELYRDACGRTV